MIFLCYNYTRLWFKKGRTKKVKTRLCKKYGSIRKEIITGICLCVLMVLIEIYVVNSDNEELYKVVGFLFIFISILVIISSLLIESNAFSKYLKSRNILK